MCDVRTITTTTIVHNDADVLYSTCKYIDFGRPPTSILAHAHDLSQAELHTVCQGPVSWRPTTVK